MNRTGRLALIPALVLVSCGATFGQLNDTIKKAPNPDNAAIQQFVENAVKNLTSDDPDKQARGRDDLAAGAALNDATAQASPVYLDAYATAVAKALTPLTQHEDMRVRLNAAIATARVAERAGNTRLADLAVKFMNDKTSAVALWGVKAGRRMLPVSIQAGGNNVLLPALGQSVQRYLLITPIVIEVYDALALDVLNPQNRPSDAMIKTVVPPMLQVFHTRVGSYGAAVPPDPAIDNVASEFFVSQSVWKVMTPQQRTEAVQLMADLISFAGQHAALMEGADRQPLIAVFKRTGAALQVIGDSMQNSTLSNAAKEVQKVSTGMEALDISKRTDALAEALKAPFPGVKPSPKLQLVPPDTEEASTPPADDGKAPGAPGNRGQPKSDAGNGDSGAQTASDATAAPDKAAPAPSPSPNPRRPAPAPAPAPPPR